jgi:hypothetical protein
MRKMLMIAALAGALAGCTTGPIKTRYDPAVVSAKLDQAEERLDLVQSAADVLLPFLQPATQAKVRNALDIARKAVIAARIANDAAEQLAALSVADAAIESAAGDVGL